MNIGIGMVERCRKQSSSCQASGLRFVDHKGSANYVGKTYVDWASFQGASSMLISRRTYLAAHPWWRKDCFKRMGLQVLGILEDVGSVPWFASVVCSNMSVVCCRWRGRRCFTPQVWSPNRDAPLDWGAGGHRTIFRDEYKFVTQK